MPFALIVLSYWWARIPVLRRADSIGEEPLDEETVGGVWRVVGRLVGMGVLLLFVTGAGAYAQERPSAERTDPIGTETERVGDRGQDLEARPLTVDDSLSPNQLVPEALQTRGPMQRRPSAVTVDTTVGRYIRSTSQRSRALFDRRSPLLGPRAPGPPQSGTVVLDSTGSGYILDAGPAEGVMRLDSDVYRRSRYRANQEENWATLAEQRRQQQTDRSGLGVNMTVPGGRESTFTTVFGKPQVDLSVNGQADISAGFQYSKNDRQGARTGDPTQLDPEFQQDLSLGITGTIGDKLEINVDWDTNSQFDYQNQVKIKYTGYEDEIIQSVEAGNVSMQTPSQLIQGGQSLFGIKSTLQFGNLSLTTIASQQEGQSNSLSIEGGAETTEFSLQPTDYDEGTHFLLGYYFRNNWNRAHQDPTRITLFNGFREVTDIEVWKLQTSTSSSEEAEVRSAAALVDLGESPEVVRQADDYRDSTQLMRAEVDQYSEADRAELRDGDQSVSSYVEAPSSIAQPLQTQDWESGKFKKLERGRDYTLHNLRGFVSLKQRLRSDEALAVAFRYRAGGEVRQIGDFSGNQGGSTGGVTADRLLLKLLRPTDPVAPGPDATNEPASWYLELRNIYQVGGRGFTANNFEFNIKYAPSGQGATETITDISNDPLLQVLGLDRIDDSGAPSPDNAFDFTNQTVNTEEGRIFFPYLEPFGARIAEVAGDSAEAAPFAFTNLYRKKKSNAEKEDTDKNVYQMDGSLKGQAKGFYDLKAFTGLVDGSVKVTSGGRQLKEGTDYVVDYQSGTVNITNETYLADGEEINISYEQQSVSSLQQKTLLGARADWSMGDQFELGGTIMRLSEDSPVDKFRIGEEPIKNTIWGFDGSAEFEPQWLTEGVDALPFLDTRADSRFFVSGEFAQLRPGHTRTDAFKRTLDRVESSSQDDYAADERNGVSYIDDFEGFENTFSLREQPGAWQVSAAPDSIGIGSSDGRRGAQERTWWRGSVGWYQLNEGIRRDLEGKVAQRGNPEATEVLDVQEVFDRDTRGQGDRSLRTLDMYFNPWQRGPYNYLNDGRNLEQFFANPRQVWGGMTRTLPEGFTDFSVQNVEFVEFIVKAYPQESDQITDGAKLHVNLGTISEDLVPNERLNTEDGLTRSFNRSDLGALSRFAGGNQDNTLDVRGNVTEDLGLDGLVSYTDNDAYPDSLREETFYGTFVDRADSLRSADGTGLTDAQKARLDAEVARILEDPSADDYHHYNNDRYFEDGGLFADAVTLQERFSRYRAGQELNSFEGQRELAEDVSEKSGVTDKPDTENLGGTGGDVNITNNYYRYSIPLDSLETRAETNGGATDYVVSKVGEDQDWYKVRIPVRAFEGKVGNIEEFTRVESIRMWTTGHTNPVTMRFASFDLVGSQWRSSEPVAKQPVEEGEISDRGEGEVRVASVNTEEDPNYEAPVGAIVSRSRTQTGAQQQDREQALLLRFDQLDGGQQRGVFKTFQQGLDLLKYSNLRMYTHVHGRSNTEQEKQKISDNLRLFVRLGSSEADNYYEYEQPLTVSNIPGTEGAKSLWRENNEMNVEMSALAQLKTARDQSGTPTDSIFTSDRVDLPLDFAPDGTTLKIRGTPSLSSVNTVVIGVRHVGEPVASPTLNNVEVWTNELRVSGFDEDSGWATTATTDLELADFVTVSSNFNRRTEGFGSLSSTLNSRQQSSQLGWDVRTRVQVDALLPERQNWTIPLTMSVNSSLTEEEFDPSRGDIRVDEVKQQFDILPDSTIQQEFGDQYSGQSPDEIRQTLQDSVQRASESYSLERSLGLNGISKSGSESWWVRNTVDGTTLNFSYSDRSSRSPNNLLDNRWGWDGGFTYQTGFGSKRTVRPLGFLPEVPVLERLGAVDFNYVPSSFRFGASADRSVTTRRERPTGRRRQAQPTRVTEPFQDSQDFTHRRNFKLDYQPFPFLDLSFDTNTRQNLNQLSSQQQQNVILTEGASGGARILTDVDTSAVFANPQRFGFAEDVGTDSLRRAQGETLFIEERLRTASEREVFQDLFLGSASPRTERYEQGLTATLQWGIFDRKRLDWLSVQDLSYQSSFDWQNGSRGSLTGASVQNSVSLQTGGSLHPNKVWQRFGFFERMQEAQQTDGTDSASNAPAADTARADTTNDGPGLEDLPLPSPGRVLRGIALTFMDIKDLSITYNGQFRSSSSNVGRLQGPENAPTGVSTNYSLLDALLRDQGPSLGYRLGASRSIDLDKRAFEDGQVVDNLQNSHRFEARTALTPSSSFNIDLNWNVSWSNQEDIDIQRLTENPTSPDTLETIQRFTTESGETSASVWGFGSYQSLVEKQLATLRNAQENPSEYREASDIPLKSTAVAADFRDAFLIGGGLDIGGNGFAPFPMPGWTVRYSGLSDWPFVEDVTESVSLNHGYSAEYKTGFNSVSTAGDSLSLSLNGQTFNYVEASFEPRSTQVQERFQPLVGLDVTWPFGVQTSVEWNRRTTTALRGTNVVERKTGEFSGRVSYSTRGLPIPFFTRIENRLQFSLTFTRSSTNNREFLLNRALREAQSNPELFNPRQALKGDNVDVQEQTTLLTIQPKVNYSVSNRVNASLQLSYEKQSGGNNLPSYTRLNGTFNLSVSVSEN